MKSANALPNVVMAIITASALLLAGCGGGGNNKNVKGGGAGIMFPAVNPAFDSITEVALSPEPGGPYDEILKPGREYTFDPDTESITVKGGVEPGGEYARITGLATVSGTQDSYIIYTFMARTGDRVAANELTSAAVGLVASGDAADFPTALGVVETEFGLPAGSAAEAVAAEERPAELVSVLAASAPAFAKDAVPGFDVTSYTAADLADSVEAYLDCVVLGGLAWDSWHKTDAGGSGLPADEADGDYTRCKACHGWDQLGTEGGYVRRSRNAGRANAGYQDPNNCDLPGANTESCTRSRNISTDPGFGSDSSIEIPGGGRLWSEGSWVFDTIEPDWGPGAILGNRHPDLSEANAGGPTMQQLSCLTAFLNAPDAQVGQVYAAIETQPADGKSLAVYTPVDTADAQAGATYYADNCQGCHGDPSDDGIPDVGGLIAYLNEDGKFSEFMHKMHWGIPNTIMSRAAMGEPAAADVANVVSWMQAIPFLQISAAQVVPPVADITARGSGTYILTDAGLEYAITIDTASLSGPVVSAHFHHGRVGTNGEVVRDLSFTDGQAVGIWNSMDSQPLTPELTDALLAGNIYVNIHTAANPSGEIRGQVRAVRRGDNQPPVADISVDPDLIVAISTVVTLDASGSSDPDTGPLPLTYSWTLGVPMGSTAVLSDASSVSPTFTADVEGDYLATLTVDDGLDADTAEVAVAALTGNLPPTADAGTAQDVDTGSLVTLDGSGSFDPDTGPSPLSYSWTLDTVPAGSTATLANANTANPTFTADLDGDYTATLVVNDGQDDSTPDSVNITASAPSGSFEAGRAKYDADCAGCHAAGTYDPNGFAGDIAGTGNLLVNDLGTLDPGMNGILITDQEILDLQAFLDDPSIQP